MTYRLRYGGSLFWLIFWAILFFPIAFVLLLTNWEAQGGTSLVRCNYSGSRFWLGFWTLVFFPIALLLILLNGFIINNK